MAERELKLPLTVGTRVVTHDTWDIGDDYKGKTGTIVYLFEDEIYVRFDDPSLNTDTHVPYSTTPTECGGGQWGPDSLSPLPLADLSTPEKVEKWLGS